MEIDLQIVLIVTVSGHNLSNVQRSFSHATSRVKNRFDEKLLLAECGEKNFSVEIFSIFFSIELNRNRVSQLRQWIKIAQHQYRVVREEIDFFPFNKTRTYFSTPNIFHSFIFSRITTEMIKKTYFLCNVAGKGNKLFFNCSSLFQEKCTFSCEIAP